MEKLEPKKGDKVRYRATYMDGGFHYVYCEVTVGPEDVNFPSVELNNGHTARWDGEKYFMEGMSLSQLEKEPERKELTETPKRYDEINHIDLRSDLENELLIGSFYYKAEPGQDREITFEGRRGSNPLVYSYKYSQREYEQDCEIMGIN
jgi:hypothetical protein